MDKIFDIVGSLIPDEQKADIKSKIDGEITKVISDNENKLKRELSAKYKVDLFQDDINLAFNEKNFIPKDKVKELNEKLVNQEEQIKSFETTKQELETKLNGYETNHNKYESSLKLVSNGFNPERLHLINNELTGAADEDLKVIGEKYPEMFRKEIITKNPIPGKKEEKPKTEAELYIERRKKQFR